MQPRPPTSTLFPYTTLGRGTGTTELACGARIQPPRVRGRNCKVGAIECIKELRPELRRVPFLKLPLLADREIHIVIVRHAEPVAAGVAHSSESRGRQKAAVLRVAAIIRQRRVGQRDELGIPGIRSLGGGLARCRGGTRELRNGMRSGLKCRHRPAVIPRLQGAGNGSDELPGSDYVVCNIGISPRQSALQSYDSAHGLTLEHLRR